MDERRHQLEQWLTQNLNIDSHSPALSIEAASSDASFRRYFRARLDGESYIIMDAPPKQEDCIAFITISGILAGAGLNVPRVLKMDLDNGFLLLTDLGEKQYLEVLAPDTVETLYSDAMQALHVIQKIHAPANLIPDYSHELLMNEMLLFRDWFLVGSLKSTLIPRDETILAHAFELLAREALSQPRVLVHRDYHSRNLMLIDSEVFANDGTRLLNPGILDFQDAVIGPISYDLVSLLRDCYVNWPQHQVTAWVKYYHDILIHSGLIPGSVSLDEFQRWFDWMGVQRHLKAIGIFSRLHIRDNKPGYRKDIPRTIQYVLQVCSDYKELHPLGEWLSNNVISGFPDLLTS